MNKEQQKELLKEIMEADAKDGLYHIGNTNKMVTAVEWFYQRILAEDIKSVFEQAKAMEKEQIIKAWDDGDYAYFHSKETGRDFDNGEQYYNETYNK